MGWDAIPLGGKEFLILSTQGGIRAPDGTPIALGYHTGHWEVGLLMQAAAEELRRAGAVPFAGFVTDPCDGRTQGTAGMMDSLPYRNDAATVLRRLIRSLPTRRGVMGVATCDKGLPAMMMALAGSRDLPGVLVPGGVTLPPTEGRGRGQDADDRRALRAWLITLRRGGGPGLPGLCAARAAAASFWARRRRRRWSAKRWGCRCRIRRWRPSGQPIWLDMARRSARALLALESAGDPCGDILTDAGDPQRDGGACGVWRIDQSAAAHAGHRARGGLRRPTRRRLDRGQRACRGWSMRCRTARWAIRRCGCSWPAACRK